MKKYKFEYIKENVLQWKNDLLENITVSDVVNAIPFGVMLPWVMPNEYKPAVDYYGEEIEDIDDYMHQRDEYIKKLVEEIKKDIDSSRADVF